MVKWGFASTAAIVRSLQKDFYYRKELENDLRLLCLDNLSTINREQFWYLLP